MCDEACACDDAWCVRCTLARLSHHYLTKAPHEALIHGDGASFVRLPAIQETTFQQGLEKTWALKPGATVQQEQAVYHRGLWVFPESAKGVMGAYRTDCWKHYKAGPILGSGAFGTTYLATKRGTEEQYAVKMISKRKLASDAEVASIRREVQALHHLAGHPGIVQIQDVYEDRNYVSLVTELCGGGDLHDVILRRGALPEPEAAALLRAVVDIVAHCHAMGVMHCDIKPDNFMLSDDTPDARLKAIDFGHSQFFKEGQQFSEVTGSLFYVAPEVISGSYGKEADLWSCGIILHCLLCGFPPFRGSSPKDVMDNIRSGPLDFPAASWAQISGEAKDLVRALLERDPARRATVQQVLQHPWLQRNGVASDKGLHVEVLCRLHRFSIADRFKKLALKVVASKVPGELLHGMHNIFRSIDREGSGRITPASLATELRRKGSSVSDDEVAKMFQKVDTGGDGSMGYEEFIAATMDQTKLSDPELLQQAFEHLDLDGDGLVSSGDLEAVASCGSLDKLAGEQSHRLCNAGQPIDYDIFCRILQEP